MMIEFAIALVVMLAVVLLVENKHHRKHAALVQELKHANNKSEQYLCALLGTMLVVENSYRVDIPGYDKMREKIHTLDDQELLEEYLEEMRTNYDACNRFVCNLHRASVGGL